MSETQRDNIYKTLHPDYKIVGYDGTSRVYSGNPSLSQIPKILRYAVIPHDGNKFLYTDLKAAEVYVLVRWSKCTPLVHTYETGGDLYTHIAKVVLGKESITTEERDTIKVVVLSILYGSTGYSASRTLHITEEEAKGMVDVFFRAFPEIAEFQAKAYKYVQEHEYIQSFYFRPRILKADLTGDDSTFVGVFIGFSSHQEIQSYYYTRYLELKQNYIDPFNQDNKYQLWETYKKKYESIMETNIKNE